MYKESKKLSELVSILSKNENYKVLEKFERREQYNSYSSKKEKTYKGIFLDVETTGLDIRTNKIIELALVPFEYSKEGKIFKVLEGYSALDDPKEVLTEEITSLTGITNEMVKDQKIDAEKVESIVNSADLIIAHNASFDRKVVEKRFQVFKNKPWACSYTQVHWDKENITSAKLDYLAYKFNFFYDAHRAEVDCLVGIHILAQTLPLAKEWVLKNLLEEARKECLRVWAEGSPFETKDILKSRGYKFDGTKKSWFIEIESEELQEEIIFLQTEVYKYKKEIKSERITALNRFRDL